MSNNIKIVMAAIGYIEDYLQEKLDLETVANGVHYSKYHCTGCLQIPSA